MLRIISFIMATVVLLTGCQSAGLYLANLPHQNSTHHKRIENIAYGDESWQKLDLYLPVHPITTQGNIPTVMFFYGGGWSSGTKEDYLFVADTLTKAGFIVAVVDYVKYPQATYPAYVKDAAKATDWLYHYIAHYGGNPENMHVMGHSAGAHIAMMLMTDETFLAEYGLKPQLFRSMTGLAGPYHFTPTDTKYVKIFNGKEHFPAMQAGHFIDGTEPPMLLLHGNDDSVVGKINIEEIQPILQEKGSDVDVKYYDGIGHINIIGAFSHNFATDAPIVEDVIDFISKHGLK